MANCRRTSCLYPARRAARTGCRTGVYPPGERVPAVRDLAAQAQVNPNTMQRALAEMESRGLLVTQRTAGRTVTSDTTLIAKTRQALAASLAQDFLAQAKALGLPARKSSHCFNRRNKT